MRRRSLSRGMGGSLVERSNSKGEDSPTHCDVEPRMTVGRHVEQATGGCDLLRPLRDSRCDHVACVTNVTLASYGP
jgi:hypothetical protein